MSAVHAIATMPLVWLVATLAVFEGADRLSRAAGRHPLLHPVLISVAVLALLLLGSGTPYRVYAQDTRAISFLLGPATIALAVPLWRNWPLVRASAKPVLVALVAGSFTAIASTAAFAWLLGAPPEIVASVAPRAATTPVAMPVAEGIGGIASIAAVAVLISGIVGAMIATPLLNRLGLGDPRARGFAAGITAHGLGTARAFQVSETAGTFAGMAMALNAAMTALLLSLVALM
jgi:predicted murein hydrolase (TIGR00659 family)